MKAGGGYLTAPTVLIPPAPDAPRSTHVAVKSGDRDLAAPAVLIPPAPTAARSTHVAVKSGNRDLAASAVVVSPAPTAARSTFVAVETGRVPLTPASILVTSAECANGHWGLLLPRLRDPDQGATCKRIEIEHQDCTLRWFKSSWKCLDRGIALPVTQSLALRSMEL